MTEKNTDSDAHRIAYAALARMAQLPHHDSYSQLQAAEEEGRRRIARIIKGSGAELVPGIFTRKKKKGKKRRIRQ